MRKYDHDPKLFEDCDPYRIPYGCEGYDPFVDRPLVRLTAANVFDQSTLDFRQYILNARQQRFHNERRLEDIQHDARRAKDLLSRRA